MEQQPSRRPDRRREAADASRVETRRRLIAAAGEEFVAVGYVAATVNRIAARAGVSVQTLYLACGSKAELLRAYLESTLFPGSPPSPAYFTAQLVPGSPSDTIRQISRLFRETAERSADGWAVYRDAAAVDAAIAEDWERLQALRRRPFEQLLGAIPDEALRLPRDDAVDTAWAIASPDAYDLLVRRAGYPLERLERWIDTTLIGALLRED